MVSPPADISLLASLAPWGGGAVLVVALSGIVWKGGLKDFIDGRRIAQKESKATDLAIAVAHANMTGSLERGLQAAERTADKYDKMLVRQEEIARRHEALLESQET